MRMSSPNTLSFFFFFEIERRNEWEKDQLLIPEQSMELPYASVSSSQNRNDNGAQRLKVQ